MTVNVSAYRASLTAAHQVLFESVSVLKCCVPLVQPIFTNVRRGVEFLEIIYEGIDEIGTRRQSKCVKQAHRVVADRAVEIPVDINPTTEEIRSRERLVTTS